MDVLLGEEEKDLSLKGTGYSMLLRLVLNGWAKAWVGGPEILPAVGQASAMFPRRSRVNVSMWVHWAPPVEFNRIQTLAQRGQGPLHHIESECNAA